MVSAMDAGPLPLRLASGRATLPAFLLLFITGCSGIYVGVDANVADLSRDHLVVTASVRDVLYNNDPIGCSSSQVLRRKDYRIEYPRDDGSTLQPLTIQASAQDDPQSRQEFPSGQEQLASEHQAGPNDAAWQEAVSHALALVVACGPPTHTFYQPCRTWISADHQWIVCAPMYTPARTFALNGVCYAAQNNYVAFSRAAPLGRVITRRQLNVPRDSAYHQAATLNDVASVRGELQLEFIAFDPPGLVYLIVSPSSGRRHMMTLKDTLDRVWWDAQAGCLIVQHWAFPTTQLRFTEWNYRLNKALTFSTDVARLFRSSRGTLVPEPLPSTRPG
jgi:hypothetical protein